MKIHCPKCNAEMSQKKIDKLKKQEVILCRGCSTYLRIHRKSIPFIMSIIGGVVGVYGASRGFEAVELTVFMSIFSLFFYFIFTRFIGVYYKLEEVDSNDA
ncbi:hypothetical protein C1E24_09810 [Pseudoalteromonas phenolica]|uniref:Uncharacterized protein n=1 Tax=Pseudoalteromonas phenolica TaxID=161398 RepID=A0A5R9Q1R7_9GAMM|nr:hypothetical protein [Pseudoalteromonas phenolica]TLX47091.1 hypothetical protein C1E24_09810 [Pseudoalteromonas phenolica]